jgi:hypothetical protein
MAEDEKLRHIHQPPERESASARVNATLPIRNTPPLPRIDPRIHKYEGTNPFASDVPRHRGHPQNRKIARTNPFTNNRHRKNRRNEPFSTHGPSGFFRSITKQTHYPDPQK